MFQFTGFLNDIIPSRALSGIYRKLSEMTGIYNLQFTSGFANNSSFSEQIVSKAH